MTSVGVDVVRTENDSCARDAAGCIAGFVLCRSRANISADADVMLDTLDFIRDFRGK